MVVIEFCLFFCFFVCCVFVSDFLLFLVDGHVRGEPWGLKQASASGGRIVGRPRFSPRRNIRSRAENACKVGLCPIAVMCFFFGCLVWFCFFFIFFVLSSCLVVR